MTGTSKPSLALAALVAGVLLMGGFAGLVLHYGRDLRVEIRQKMVERDAAVLSPVAQQQIEAGAAAVQSGDTSESLLASLLPDARREGLLAMAIFDADGIALQHVPANQLLVELPLEDYAQLQNGRAITRYHPEFVMAQLFPGSALGPPIPVLEILLPLHASRRVAQADPGTPPIGFVRYHLDARPLAAELGILDSTVHRQTVLTLALGLVMIAVVAGGASIGLRRAQRTIQERTQRLQHANFELTLSAKASALGQITSHLIHGLQGPVAGLRAVVAGRGNGAQPDDWQTAAAYTERMQAIIQETVAMLGDASASATYELTGHELAEIVRRRNLPVAEKKQVSLQVTGGFEHSLDSHRGGLLCLIVSNLVENAIAATDPGRLVAVSFRNGGVEAIALVSDEGHGIPETLRPHLFEPGRSSRPGGTGLGLAISQLLARQIGARLTLESTGPDGTVFRLTVPLDSRSV